MSYCDCVFLCVCVSVCGSVIVSRIMCACVLLSFLMFLWLGKTLSLGYDAGLGKGCSYTMIGSPSSDMARIRYA